MYFEALLRQVIYRELKSFIGWINDSKYDAHVDPLPCAGIRHFWFITIHPMEYGNCRLAGLLTDLVLAQAEHQSIRFYATSVAILERRNSYYEILE